MDTGVKTQQRRDKDVSSSNNPIFRKLPPQYYGYALQWCNYSRWTIEETANLLAGCVPHRELFLKGSDHAQLDQEVIDIENRIRAATDDELEISHSKKYFSETYVTSASVIDWAKKQDMVIPKALLKAWRETRNQVRESGYTTPCLEAIQWVVENYWQNADLREPPTPGEIINALLQQFPDLSGQDCEMVEQVTRHPVARLDKAD